MQVPSLNLIGGVLAAVALGAVLYFGAHAPPTVSTVAPVSEPQVLKPPVVEKPLVVEKSPVVPPVVSPLVKKPTTYRRVRKGGKIDGKVKCKSVPPVAHQFSKDQVLDAAKEYGLSPAQISALRVCFE